eukprot:4161443-Pyramimonas_sp.AAC.1
MAPVGSASVEVAAPLSGVLLDHQAADHDGRARGCRADRRGVRTVPEAVRGAVADHRQPGAPI